jgi:hypothetical protein
MESPKMPQQPAETPPPPDKSDEAAQKAAAAQAAQANLQRGRRSTIVAGYRPVQPLGGTKSILGGGGTTGTNA